MERPKPRGMTLNRGTNRLALWARLCQALKLISTPADDAHLAVQRAVTPSPNGIVGSNPTGGTTSDERTLSCDELLASSERILKSGGFSLWTRSHGRCRGMVCNRV